MHCFWLRAAPAGRKYGGDSDSRLHGIRISINVLPRLQADRARSRQSLPVQPGGAWGRVGARIAPNPGLRSILWERCVRLAQAERAQLTDRGQCRLDWSAARLHGKTVERADRPSAPGRLESG